MDLQQLTSAYIDRRLITATPDDAVRVKSFLISNDRPVKPVLCETDNMMFLKANDYFLFETNEVNGESWSSFNIHKSEHS